VTDPWRPAYHLAPDRGWINDPVGLVHWRGRHHVFAQANPDAPVWDRMHWAHWSGADPVRRRAEPVALVPPPRATPGDASGIWSGSAVDAGELTLVYTIYTDVTAHPGAVPETIGIATSPDGVTFTPYPGNPVVAGPPEPGDFRDPRVFRSGSSWSMVVGAVGRVLLYDSADLRRWTYRGVLHEEPGAPMWECPDLFRLGPDWVLMVSAPGRVRWWLGSYDGRRFRPRTAGVLDGGPAFYAAQQYPDDQGRALVVGWMGQWGVEDPTAAHGWAGALSVTRELVVRDGRVGSRPVAELASLRGAPARAGDALDLVATGSFTLSVRASAAEATVVRLRDGVLTLDTTRSGVGAGGVWTAAGVAGPVRVLVDRSSVEVFAATGESLTARVYPAADSAGVAYDGDGTLECWSLS
jgi:sucrose-6-phosphate hydrolase SacC (GH32 family)